MAHILIIDDESQIRMMLRMMLESEGYTVDEAADGTEGINLYRKNPADLIITDIIMPGKEGLETIISLRKEYPGIKIIAMSGGGRNNPEGYLKSAKLLGALETFAKPIRKETLLSAVRRLI
jgi:CheY-like chemotaxis protein